MKTNVNGFTLLESTDPRPIEIVNPSGGSPLLLVCEHAGQAIPSRLGDLGISSEELDDHIGWDIGAAAVTRILAKKLDAVALLQPYSRLVIDCNRPPHAPDAIPTISDGVTVPANVDLSETERVARMQEIFLPFHAEIDGHLDSNRYSAAISIHSFTPRMNNASRPWDIGFLYRSDTNTSILLRDSLVRHYPYLAVGMNEPYQISDLSDWFVPRQAETRGISHSLIEIRNDHIHTAAGQQQWAEMVSRSVQEFLNRKIK